MKRELLNAQIKVRVPRTLRRKAEKEASRDQLELSDVVRRALREYFLQPTRTQRPHVQVS